MSDVDRFMKQLSISGYISQRKMDQLQVKVRDSQDKLSTAAKVAHAIYKMDLLSVDQANKLLERAGATARIGHSSGSPRRKRRSVARVPRASTPSSASAQPANTSSNRGVRYAVAAVVLGIASGLAIWWGGGLGRGTVALADDAATVNTEDVAAIQTTSNTDTATKNDDSPATTR